MAAQTYDLAMQRIFASEGGFTDNPHDPGGATNWGITIFDARIYWKTNATAEDVRNMPKSVAANIYRKHYANPIKYDDLPAGFDYSILDASVNSGIRRAIPWASQAIGIKGKKVDDVAIAASAMGDKVALIQRYWSIRLSFLHGLRIWRYFGGGWGRRCATGEAAAVKMWLQFGANLSPADVNGRMDAEARKAKTSMAKHASGSVIGGVAGTGAAGQAASSFTLSDKIILAIGIAVAVAFAIYFIRQAVIHSQRLAAYRTA